MCEYTSRLGSNTHFKPARRTPATGVAHVTAIAGIGYALPAERYLKFRQIVSGATGVERQSRVEVLNRGSSDVDSSSILSAAMICRMQGMCVQG